MDRSRNLNNHDYIDKIFAETRKRVTVPGHLHANMIQYFIFTVQLLLNLQYLIPAFCAVFLLVIAKTDFGVISSPSSGSA